MDGNDDFPMKPMQHDDKGASGPSNDRGSKPDGSRGSASLVAAALPSAALQAVDRAAAALFGSTSAYQQGKDRSRSSVGPALPSRTEGSPTTPQEQLSASHTARQASHPVQQTQAYHHALPSPMYHHVLARPRSLPQAGMTSTLDIMFPSHQGAPTTHGSPHLPQATVEKESTAGSMQATSHAPTSYEGDDFAAAQAAAIQRQLEAHAKRTGDATLLQGKFGHTLESMSGQPAASTGLSNETGGSTAAAGSGASQLSSQGVELEEAGAMPEVMAAARAMWEASLRGDRPDVEGFVGAVERQAARAGEAPLREHERAMLRAWADVSDGGALGMDAGDLGVPGAGTSSAAALDSELGDPDAGGVGGEQGEEEGADWDAPVPSRYRYSDPESNVFMPAAAKTVALRANSEDTDGAAPVPASTEDGERAMGAGEAAKHGRELFESGRPGPAVQALESAVAQDSSDAESWLALGHAHAEMEDDLQAIACLEAAVKADPHDLHALLQLAVSYLNERMDARALRCIKAWVECNPSMAAAGVHVAGHGAGRPAGVDGRREAFDELLELMKQVEVAAPDDPEVLGLLGVVFNLTRQAEAAEAVLRRAVQHEPSNHVLWNRLGATINNAGRPADAVPAYQEAVRLRPTFARGFFNLGIALFDSDQHMQSARAFTRALQLNPNATHIWSHVRVSLAVAEEFDLVDACGPEDVNLLVQAMRDSDQKEPGGGSRTGAGDQPAGAAGGH